MEKVNLNEASRSTISRKVGGIGKVLSDRIKQFQENHGRIHSFDQLAGIRGIGKKRMWVLRNTCELGHNSNLFAIPQHFVEEPDDSVTGGLDDIEKRKSTGGRTRACRNEMKFRKDCTLNRILDHGVSGFSLIVCVLLLIVFLYIVY